LTISSISTSFDEEAQLAVNPSGYAVVVWTEPSGLKAATRQFGSSSWSPPLTIPTMTNIISTPQVAVDLAGNAIAVWQDNTSIFSSTLTFGNSNWSPFILVSPATETSTIQPRVGVDASGNAVAIWENLSNSTSIIEAATLPFGSSSWSSIATLSNLDVIEPPALAVNAAGFSVATWIANTESDFVVQAATLPSIEGTWNSAQNVSSGTDASTPTVAVDSAGNAIAVWAENISSNVSFIQSAYLPFGSLTWQNPLNITPPIAIACACDPAVALDASGNAIATWHTMPDISLPEPTDIVQAATFAKGGSAWSPPTNLSDASQISDFSQVVVDPTGYAVVSWTNESLIQKIQATVGIPAPTVIHVNPNIGPTTGENLVTITGTNFLNVSSVHFGSASASFTTISPTTIIATAPPGGAPNATTIVDVKITTSAETSSITLNDQYIYQDPPTVTHVNPNNGPASGGNQVTITGTNFLNVYSVHFDSAIASFTTISPTTIIATAPPGGDPNTMTTVDITVTTTVDTSPLTSDDQYTYHNSPTVTKLDPNSGLPEGGNTILITGTNFLNVTSVTFGGINAISFAVLSPTSISAVVPPGTAGSTVDVRVTTPVDISPITPDDQYTYQQNVPNLPTITHVKPNKGPSKGGNKLAIKGTNFLNVTSVTFGEINAISFNVLSPTSIHAVVPPGTAGSTVDIRVTTAVGTSPVTPNDQYTYKGSTPPSRPPKPPSHFIGIIKENKYLNKAEYLLKATWDPSPSLNVVLYRVYKRGKIVKKISIESSSSSSTLAFEKILHSKKSARGYSITAVNSDGLESRHVKLRIVHR
jgi:hypothetical protein